MKKQGLFLTLLFIVLAVPAFAQLDVCDPYCSPDLGIGSGNGFVDGTCATCVGNQYDGFWCYRAPLAGPGESAFLGYAQCLPHNNMMSGFKWCEVSQMCWGQIADNGHGDALSPEQQIKGIETYLREATKLDGSSVISADALNDFIAATDFALRGETYASARDLRLAAYRAKFKALVGRELKPGAIPVWGHPLTKTPSSTVATL